MLHDTVDSSLGVIARGNRTHPRVCRRHSCYHESPAPQFQRPIDVEMLTYSSLQSKFTAIEETFSTAKRVTSRHTLAMHAAKHTAGGQIVLYPLN